MKKVEITTLETVIEVREKSLTLQGILPLGTPPQAVGGKKRNSHSREMGTSKKVDSGGFHGAAESQES